MILQGTSKISWYNLVQKNTLLLFGNMAWFLMDIKKHAFVKIIFLTKSDDNERLVKHLKRMFT